MLTRILICVVLFSIPLSMTGCGGQQGGSVAENADDAAIAAYEAALKEQESLNEGDNAADGE